MIKKMLMILMGVFGYWVLRVLKIWVLGNPFFKKNRDREREREDEWGVKNGLLLFE